ncbi:MAG: hypothetical protein IPM54_30910 [Polyangiaceae bacterium]|nr:hypothetical protein [Polyangiaceae bacterium]
MRYVRLALVYMSLSARAAVPLGAPLFFGVFVVAFIVFGPTGMRAADLVFTLRTSWPLAFVLWTGWLVLALPVARLALVPPSSMYLRWLPAPRWVLYASAALSGLVVELPWMVLFGRGESIASGFAAGLGALAVHAALVTRPVGIVHVLVALGWAAIALQPSVMIAFPTACIASLIAVGHAMDRAPEMHAMARGSVRARAPVIALAMTHLFYVLRKEPAVLGRAFILSILAGLSLPMAARGHDLETPPAFGALSLGLAAVAISPAMSGSSAAVIRSERLSAWLCDVMGTSPRTRALAAALATSVIGAAAGLFLGLVAAILLRHSAWTLVRVAMIPLFFGMAVGGAFAGFAREADASPKRGDRGMVSALVVTIMGVVTASLWGERALLLHLVLAALSIAIAMRRAEVLRRRRGVS